MNKKEQKNHEEDYQQLINHLKSLQLKNKMGQLVHTHEIKQCRKQVARLLTKKNSNSSQGKNK